MIMKHELTPHNIPSYLAIYCELGLVWEQAFSKDRADAVIARANRAAS